MPDHFRQFIQVLRSNLKDRIQTDWSEYRESLFTIGEAFVDRSAGDLRRWTGLLSVGALTKEDFSWLVEGRKDLAEVEALRNAGLTLAQTDRLRASLMETVVGTAFSFFL